jgi:hypothetical protein
MKENSITKKSCHYEAPTAEVIVVEWHGVLCISGATANSLSGNSTESVTSKGFTFP